MEDKLFTATIETVTGMLKEHESTAMAENYVTSLYAEEKITSRQFELLNGIIY